MAWVNIEPNNNLYTYQLDLSKLANHGDACVIGGRYVDASNAVSYLYGKWGFDIVSSEPVVRGNYWTINRDYYNNHLFVIEDPSVQNTPGSIMEFSVEWKYSTGWSTDISSLNSDINSDLNFPTFILNDNGIIRIIKDKTTLQTFLSGYPYAENVEPYS